MIIVSCGIVLQETIIRTSATELNSKRSFVTKSDFVVFIYIKSEKKQKNEKICIFLIFFPDFL